MGTQDVQRPSAIANQLDRATGRLKSREGHMLRKKRQQILMVLFRVVFRIGRVEMTRPFGCLMGHPPRLHEGGVSGLH